MAAGALIVSEAGGVVRFVFISSFCLALLALVSNFLSSCVLVSPSQVLDPSGGDFDLMSCDILVCR